VTYLNHAGTSWPKPAPVQAAAAAALEADPAGWDAAFELAHRRVAAALGVRDAERLLLTPGCTSALHLGVTDHGWRAGDRILVSALEHHALHRPAALLRERGVELDVVPRAAGAAVDLDALARELERGGVRLVAMTAACSVTGELAPVAEIVALAHAHGALCLIDGAQACGWVPVDVAELGVDLFAFAGHKGLQAPWGVGGLYVAPHAATSTPAATCGLYGECAPTMPGYCDAGSVDRAALAGLAAGLDWLDEHPERLERARALVARLAGALVERPRVRLHGAAAARLPTVAFTCEQRPTRAVAAAFAARGVTVGAGLLCAPLAHEALGTATDGVVRLSVGPQTRAEELEVALEVIASL
jgi:selenocysteine lyase/cysteine desulfurase